MANVYEIVKENILDRLEEAIKNGEKFNWVKPWTGSIAPTNFKSKKRYNGINILLLPLGGYYLTFKQIAEMGGKVNKGAKSYPIYYWNFVTKTVKNEKGEDEEKEYPIFKYYKVFHQDDITDIKFPEIEIKNEHTLNESCEDLLKKYSEIVPMRFIEGSSNAYYYPNFDEIVLPDKSQFLDINEFYSTAFHESIHSTGHKSRLNRLSKDAKFGNKVYSKEELVAEIGASMLRAYFGIESKEVDKNTIAYLQGWISHIRENKSTEIVHAAQQAQKAVDFILDKVKDIEKCA